MVQGNFFKVDTDSLLNEGQVIFRYLPVHKSQVDDSKSHHHYPIYVVLKPFAIDFYYHGPDVEKTDNKDEIHVHTCILHLPLSLNLAVKDNLTARLSRMFYDRFLIGEKYKFELSETFTAYWNLDVFQGERGGYEKESKYDDESKRGTWIVLRKLVLDFIFDLEHSKVFETSPHYEEVEVHLRENYYFNAITAKAAYYYNRKKYIDNFINDKVQDLYAHSLAEAEVQWLNILRDPRATESFWHEDWFMQVEEEYKKVLFDKSFDRYSWRAQLGNGKDNIYEQKNIRILRESARWFLRRYGLVNGIRALLQYRKKAYALILLFLLSFVAFPIWLANFNQQHFFLAYFIYFLVGFIPFIIGFLFIYREMFLPIIGALLPRLIMAITSAWLFFTSNEELWKSSFDIKLDSQNLWVLFLLIPVIIFMLLEIRNLAPDIKTRHLVRRMVYVLGVGLFYSVLIGIFFVNFTGNKILVRSGYLQDFYLSAIQDTTGFFSTDTCSVVALGLGLADDENDIFAKYKKIRMNDLSTNNPALLVKIDFLRDHFPKVYKKIQKNYDKWISIMKDPSQKMAYNYLDNIKYPSNLMMNAHVALKYNIKILRNYFKMDIFPGFLFFRNFFALFIGIFIQLIFEDKPITEPL